MNKTILSKQRQRFIEEGRVCAERSTLKMSSTETSAEVRRPRRRTVYGEIYDPAEDREDLPPPPHKTPQQLEKLLDKIQGTSFLKELDESRLRAAISYMTEKSVSAGETVIKQGDPGDHFYIIEKGRFEALIDGKVVGTYENRGSFGELALLYNEPRAATVRAVTDGVLWQLERKVYTRVVVRMAYERRQHYQRLLESVPMLQSVEPYERLRLCDALESKHYDKGEIIVKQGDRGDGMYFVEDGEVTVVKSEKGKGEKEIGVITRGGFFGELALITNMPRAATVIAKTKVQLAFLDVDSFERLLGKCVDIMKRDIPHYEEQVRKLFGSKKNTKKILR